MRLVASLGVLVLVLAGAPWVITALTPAAPVTGEARVVHGEPLSSLIVMILMSFVLVGLAGWFVYRRASAQQSRGKGDH